MASDPVETRPVPRLALLVPCYNEQETLPATIAALASLLADCVQKGLARPDSFVCYVDDGSKDGTWDIIEARHRVDPACRGIKFAANAGQENAIWAALTAARKWGADCAVSLDADLQDDISVIPEMLARYREGFDIVFGVRSSRPTDTVFKRGTAHLFYKFMATLKVTMIPDHSDYRLVSRPVLDVLRGFGEQSLFLRGLFPVIGFKTCKVYYQRQPRQAGESKYPLRKMIAYAWQGITSCSVAPLRLAGILGFICMLLALISSVVSIYKYAIGAAVPGWTSLIIIILFLGAAQLFCLGVMGEYVAKIFMQVRRRPRYIVEKRLR